MELYEHQKTGAAFLVNKRRAILADEMGVGKSATSVEALNRLQTLLKWSSDARVLIVCPKVVKSVWKRELVTWGFCKPSDITVVDGTFLKRASLIKQKTKCTIIGYEVARMLKHMPSLKEQGWEAFVFDEAHRLKNRKSKTFRAIKQLTAPYRFAQPKPLFLLTGTPILNRPEEIWALLHILFPKVYSSFWKWVAEHCNTMPSRFGRGEEVVGLQDVERTKKSLEHLYIRRTKEEVLDLPQKQYIPFYVELPPDQRKLYEKMKKEFWVEHRGKMTLTDSVVAQLVRLKQICVSPDLLDKETDELTGAKIDAIHELIEDSGDEKIVIFSQFATVIRRLEKQLRPLYPLVRLIGEDDDQSREDSVRAFQIDPKIKLFLTSIQAGGVGITLHAASIGIFTDLLWTPAVNNQAADRLHRIGQTRPVSIYTLIGERTIDTRIMRLLKTKEALFESIIPPNSLIQGILDDMGVNFDD